MSISVPDIRPFEPADLPEWLRMRGALWPELAESDSQDEDAALWLSREDATVLVAQLPGAPNLSGFVEVGRRDFADGCYTSPVAYLEGWYVDPGERGRGVGAALLRAAESWSRSRGYRELASDALLENIPSQDAHRALGFAEVERSVKYRKQL